MVKRILVIDDDESFRKLFLRALDETPYHVDTAESGMEGIGLNKEYKYDFIFLDLYMPEMNGLQVLRKIRETDIDIPIYILTSYYKEFLDDINRARDDGLKFEITHKSNTIEQIVTIAVECLEESKVRQ